MVFISSPRAECGNQGQSCSQQANCRSRGRQHTSEVHFGHDEIPKDVRCLPEDTKRDHDASGGKEKKVEGAPEGHQHHGHHSCKLLLLPW